jgi:6-phosphogluconolactonase (cycloisomerase 2 family)
LWATLKITRRFRLRFPRTLSGFNIERNGALTPIGGTVVGHNRTGSTNLGIAASCDGRYLYTLNGATGTIGMFAVQEDGSLVSLGQQIARRLPPASMASLHTNDELGRSAWDAPAFFA